MTNSRYKEVCFIVMLGCTVVSVVTTFVITLVGVVVVDIVVVVVLAFLLLGVFII